MDDLTRALDESVLSELECPVCMDYMVPPIKLCINGHNICTKCRQRVKFCPTCSASFSEIRSVALENIARIQKYPCANRQSGCLDLFSIEQIAIHNAVCVYGKIKCPLHLFKQCSWNGLKNHIWEHAKATHPTFCAEGSTFRDPFLSEALYIISCFGELFIYYKHKKNGSYYVAVQLIGTSSEAFKYKCEFILRAANGIEQISNTFLVRSYSENSEAIFNSGKCFNLDEETVKYFVEKTVHKLSGTLSRV